MDKSLRRGILNSLKSDRVDNYFRGNRKERLRVGVQEMISSLDKNRENPDIDVVVKSIKTVSSVVDINIHDDHFMSFARGYVELVDKFNAMAKSEQVNTHLQSLVDKVFYQSSVRRLNNHLKKLSDRGKSILEKRNPSVKLSKQIIDTIGGGDV